MMKAMFAFENDILPPNINYDTPNPRAPALVDGRIQVVTEPTPLTTPYIPCNSFGFGGTLVATLLKQNPITYEDRQLKQGSLPRLVLYPGTTEAAVQYVFDYIKKNYPILQEEFYALLYKLSFTPPEFKSIRGFTVFTEDGENTPPQIKVWASIIS